MVDYRHWSLAYLMYMLPPLVLMYPMFFVLDAVFGQVGLTHMGFAYLLATGIVLLYRVSAAHAHHELWREGIAAVAAAALFFIFPPLWGIIGIVAAGYLIYHRLSGGAQRTSRARSASQSRPRQ